MAHKILHAHYIEFRDEKMMQTFDFTKTNYAANFQETILQVPVVQTLDSAIQRINLYPVDNAIGFPNTYPLDSDLSGG